MESIDELRRQIAQQLDLARNRRRAARQHLGCRMAEVDEATRRYNEVADRLTQLVIHPRMQLLAEQLENAELAPTTPRQPFRTQCRFRYTEELAGPGLFEIAIERDHERIDRIQLSSNIRFFPTSLHTSDCQTQVFDISVDDRTIADWIDERTLDCVNLVTRLKHEDEIRSENIVRDPVCGMQFPKSYAAGETELEGATYYFCTEHCRAQFAENPVSFAQNLGFQK